MATYQFLTDEWMDEVRSIRAEYDGHEFIVSQAIRVNLVVQEVPFGGGEVTAHVDTGNGGLVIDLGHLEPADLKVSLAYDIARALLIEGNPQVGLQAFMSGKIRVDGDVSKLLALQGTAPDPVAAELAGRIQAITE